MQYQAYSSDTDHYELVEGFSLQRAHIDWVKLAVTEGNPAANLYSKLGFVAGDTLHQLTKPARG